jgi:hypothetical protein
VIVLRIAEQRPSRQRSLDEVRERIVSILETREAHKLAAENGRALLERLRAGEDRQAVAAQAELSWSGEAEYERNAPEVDEGVVSTAFRMPRPAPGQVEFSATATAEGDFVIVALREVVDGSFSDDDKELREALRRNLEVEAGRASYDAVVQTLRNAADVTIIRENL